MNSNIERRRLGEQVYEVLLEELEQGKHEPDYHIVESEICSRLQVSRTPVREALYRLEQRGLLVSRPNQGFFVAPTSSQQVIEYYPVLGALEALAVRSSPVWTKTDIRRLESINRRVIRKGTSSTSLFNADLAFHQYLVGRCDNPALLQMIETARTEIRRWDGGSRRGMVKPEKAFQEHAHVISRLKAGDHEKAAQHVEEHWNSGVETVTEWIAKRESENE